MTLFCTFMILILRVAPSFLASPSFSSISRPCPLSPLPQSPDFVKPSSLTSPAGGGRGSPAVLRPYPFKLFFTFFFLFFWQLCLRVFEQDRLQLTFFNPSLLFFSFSYKCEPATSFPSKIKYACACHMGQVCGVLVENYAVIWTCMWSHKCEGTDGELVRVFAGHAVSWRVSEV